jgi:mono/diheme cytochrome c family protein
VLLALSACGADPPRDVDAANRGATLFNGAATCSLCHGGNLRGTTMGPPLLDAMYAPSRTPDESVRSAVRNGVSPKNWDLGAMPALTHLSDGDIDDIIEFIRREQRIAGID